MKLSFVFNNGTVRKVDHRLADYMERRNLGTYTTRDMRAESREKVITGEQVPVKTYDFTGLDEMSIEELRELAESLGVKVHHKAGSDKIREQLRSLEID